MWEELGQKQIGSEMPIVRIKLILIVLSFAVVALFLSSLYD